MKELTGEERWYFIKHLDIYVPFHARVSDRQRALHEAHTKGRAKVLLNDGLRDLRLKQYKKYFELTLNV